MTNTETAPAVERRERPVADRRDQIMLYGVVVDVIKMNREVPIIADRMLPEAALPDTPASAAPPGGAGFSLLASGCDPCFGEFFLDPGPTLRILGVPRGQGPERV